MDLQRDIKVEKRQTIRESLPLLLEGSPRDNLDIFLTQILPSSLLLDQELGDMLACGKSTHKMCEFLSWLGGILGKQIRLADEFSLDVQCGELTFHSVYYWQFDCLKLPSIFSGLLKAAVDYGIVDGIQCLVCWLFCNISLFVPIFIMLEVNLRRYCFTLFFGLPLSDVLLFLLLILIDERMFELLCVLIH